MAARVYDPGTDTSKPLTLLKRTTLMQNWVNLHDLHVLDAGCGAGGYIEFLCSPGVKTEGVEYEADKIASWLNAHPDDTRVKQGSVEHLQHDDEVFDAVLLNEVLEHLPDEGRALQEIYRVMKPGGFLFLFSPNRLHPFETHGFISNKTARGTGVVKTFLLPYLPTVFLSPWLHPWVKNYWPRELRTIVTSHGFGFVAQKFVWQTLENNSGYQPTYVTRLVPILRKAFAVAERVPCVRKLGVSQLIVARKPM